MKFEKLLEIILKAPELDEYSFSGNCFSMAYALNKLIPESKIVVSFNKAIYKQTGKFIGHCAIRYQNQILDGEGLISEEDFLSWGMLDEDDSNYREMAEKSQSDWKILAYDSAIQEVSEKEIENYIDFSVIECINNIIESHINYEYSKLADILSDHLYMCNKLDIDFLKKFEEFLYEGDGFRFLLVKNKNTFIKKMKNQSFSSNLEGIKNFIENFEENNPNEFRMGHKILFKAQIIGFDVQKALNFLCTNQLGITQKTFNSWNQENEIIAFEVNNLEKINLDLIDGEKNE